MKSTTLYTLSLAVGLFLTVDLAAQNGAKAPFKQIKKFELPAGLTENDYLPKTIVFKVSPQFRGGAGLTSVQHPGLQLALNYLGVEKLERKFPNHKAPEKEKNELGQKYADLSLIYQLKYTGDIDIEKAANQLMASGALTYAEPHYIFKMFDYEPNDSRADSVTGGQRNQLKRIRAYKAWDLALGGSRGDASTIIGIVDSGSDLNHPDLAANIYQSTTDPINGNDDDGDGYIDNYQGWDMGGATYNNVIGDNDPNCVGANNNHGSHVSGCSAQVGDNGTGGAGIGFGCKLLIVKAAADDDTRSNGAGLIIGGYEGIVYAADHGAQVINCSWGGAGGGSWGQDIITYATLTKNSLVVAAAGNDGVDAAFYPAAYTYVLSVAATNSTSDGKASFSNYNYTVDLSAPGNGIDATVYDNLYTTMSGTSMASPIVAGAAGLVRSKFPSYTAMQIGQRLKQTTDNNYASYNATTNPNITNPAATASALANKLGTGRLNVFRALVDAQGPSVVFQNEDVVDNNDMAFIVGDSLFITGEFVNYLAATSAGTTATIKAVVNGANVTIIDTVTTLGVLATMASTNNNADPFKFKINPGTPLNTVITFRIQIKDGQYYNNYFINVTTNVDYINIRINDLQTTITSKGRIGYNQDGVPPTEGLGFAYLGTQMMYEGGLVIGTNTTTVSDCVRGSGTNADADFASVQNVYRAVPDVISEFDCHSIFNDALASPTQNITVRQNTYAWSIPGHRKYVILEYFIKNTGATALNSLYTGIASDWDVYGPANATTDYALNRADYDATRKMGYAWNTLANGKYAGIKVLNDEPGNHYGIDNVNGGAGGIDLYDTDSYSTADKYTALSTFRAQAGFGDADGEDVLNVVSTGPFNVNAGDSIKVAFALICGDDLGDIQESADSAQVNYNEIYPVGLKSISKNDADINVYPNPASNTMFISIDNEEEGNVSVDLFNLVGQKVKSVSFENKQGVYSIDLSDLNEGAYLYRVNKGKEGNPKTTTKLTVGKIIVTKANR